MPQQRRLRKGSCLGLSSQQLDFSLLSRSSEASSYVHSITQVRQDWGIKESVGPTGWQAVMRQYLRQDRQAAAALAGQGGRSLPAPCRQAEPCPEGGLPRHTCEPAFMECHAEVCGKTLSLHMDS